MAVGTPTSTKARWHARLTWSYNRLEGQTLNWPNERIVLKSHPSAQVGVDFIRHCWSELLVRVLASPLYATRPGIQDQETVSDCSGGAHSCHHASCIAHSALCVVFVVVDPCPRARPTTISRVLASHLVAGSLCPSLFALSRQVRGRVLLGLRRNLVHWEHLQLEQKGCNRG